MMQILAVVLGLLATESAALSAVVGMNTSHLRGAGGDVNGPSYGKNSCRCVGMDNLKGYYATQLQFHHVQYSLETGSNCEAWDNGKHPECRGSVPPQWCKQEWCYVDPCSCDIDVLPKPTKSGLQYKGSPAYWSYATCGGTDFYSQEDTKACVNQKSQPSCEKISDCAWDGTHCGGKEAIKTCKEEAKMDEAVHGQDDCRCVGFGGKETGKGFLYINDTTMVPYSPNVGATCEAWESTTHPDCLKDGDKPAWCSQKWCFVDPCKCKANVPPKAVMEANSHIRFQGKTAYWSSATCGSKDSWTSEHKGDYCPPQKTEADCSKIKKCAWDAKQNVCLGKALVHICAKQEASGVLGVESPLESFALTLSPVKALLVVLGAIAVA